MYSFFINGDRICVISQNNDDKVGVTGKNVVILADYILQGNKNYAVEHFKSDYKNLRRIRNLIAAPFIAEIGIKLIIRIFKAYCQSTVTKSDLKETFKGRCSKCRNNNANVIFTQCNHFVLCYNCLENNLTCPLCRLKSNNVYLIKHKII